MRLARIEPGDLVRVDDGMPFLAEVTDKERGKLWVRPILQTKQRLPRRRVSARWVITHWKRTEGPTLTFGLGER